MTPADIINGFHIPGWTKIVIADDETRKATVYRNGSQALIGFYQTRGSKDWENNFKAWKKSYSVGSKKYKAHAGFVAEYLSLRGAILEAVRGTTVNGVYGFSQGGAHAILCCRDLIANGFILPFTATFGAPRVYDWKSANEFDKTVPKVCVDQYQFYGDPVPHLPPSWWPFGYKHVGTIKKLGKWELPFNIATHSMDAKHYGSLE